MRIPEKSDKTDTDAAGSQWAGGLDGSTLTLLANFVGAEAAHARILAATDPLGPDSFDAMDKDVVAPGRSGDASDATWAPKGDNLDNEAAQQHAHDAASALLADLPDWDTNDGQLRVLTGDGWHYVLASDSSLTFEGDQFVSDHAAASGNTNSTVGALVPLPGAAGDNPLAPADDGISAFVQVDTPASAVNPSAAVAISVPVFNFVEASGHDPAGRGEEILSGAGDSAAHVVRPASQPEATSISAADLAGAALDSAPAAITHASIGSGGATAAQLQQALDESGLSVNGSGIKVGVLSDSFNNLGGAAADEASGALPPSADVQILKDFASGGSDEGRAMMQIIHDIAPGANLAFYTAFDSEQDFANGILALAAAGSKVIVDDVSYFDEPFFQNGIVAQAIKTVEAEGVTYVTAAGNNAGNAYQAAWTPISGTFDGVHLTDAESFGGSLVQTITVGANSSYRVPLLLEWNQAYGAATSDLEILVFNNGRLVGTATNRSDGEPNNPWVGIELTGGATYQIAIENLSGSAPGLIKEITEGDGLPVAIAGANTGTVYGHAMTPGAITAGAVSAAATPAFGVNPALSESFSSSGAGTELLFTDNGTPLSSPDSLNPVVVSGVDDIHTTVSDLSDFYGTSAAAASLAGVAALILSANPTLTPAQVAQIMADTAMPIANSAVSGAGLVRVDAAVAAAKPSVTAVADHAHDLLGGTVAVSPANAAIHGVLANDFDSDRNYTLSVTAVDGSAAGVGRAVNGAFGQLTLNSDGSYTYINTNSGAVKGVAEDSFQYTASDGHGGSASSMLTVLITSPNQTYITGAAGSTIAGTAGVTVLDGTAGDMNVYAGSHGHQWLVGGPADTLFGNTANDTFMFEPHFGIETINRFNANHDVIDLPQSLVANFATLKAHMENSGGNTVIVLDAADEITVTHVAPHALHAHNFHFVL